MGDRAGFFPCERLRIPDIIRAFLSSASHGVREPIAAMIPIDQQTSYPATDAYPSFGTGLLRLAQVDDHEAINTLVELYGPLVYRWCRRTLQPADASDVVQSVFLSVWSGIKDFTKDQPGSTSLGWLRRITQHKIIDHLRSRGRSVTGEGGSGAHRRLNSLPNPGSIDDECNSDASQCRPDADQSLLLHNALQLIRGRVKATTWEAFRRSVLESATTAEIASELNLSVESVRNARFRILKQLRSLLGDDYPGLSRSNDVMGNV